jgi:hypothetical protein
MATEATNVGHFTRHCVNSSPATPGSIKQHITIVRVHHKAVLGVDYVGLHCSVRSMGCNKE